MKTVHAPGPVAHTGLCGVRGYVHAWHFAREMMVVVAAFRYYHFEPCAQCIPLFFARPRVQKILRRRNAIRCISSHRSAEASVGVRPKDRTTRTGRYKPQG